MEHDATIKRAKFIDTSVETRELFKSAAPAEVVKALKVYNSAFYGSSLWDLAGDKAKQVYTAWNTSVKLAWGCPQQTRTYFLQEVLCCGFNSARVDILSRFVKFFHGLRRSASHEVQVLCRVLARDIQSVTGRNLRLVQEMSGLDPWTTSQGRLKTALRREEMVAVPVQDRWRLPYLCTLLSQRREAHNMAMEDEEQRLTGLIDSLVIN